MFYGIGVILIVVFLNLPSWWVNYILWKYSKEIPEMPGTGGELAEHLIERFNLVEVSVRKGLDNENHFNPSTNEVVLSPNIYLGKSITSVSIAAHEVGHAVQFARNEPVSQLRSRYMRKVIRMKRIGGVLMGLIPFIGFLLKSPYVMIGVGLIVFFTMLSSVLMYFAILPEEYDASFNKALPTLKEGYIPESEYPKAKRILRAAAFTYVAAALADTIRLWRWFKIFK